MKCSFPAFLTGLSLALCISGVAAAQEGIGRAVLVDNRVEGELGGAREQILVNSAVRQNERITTYAESRAGLELVDGTSLSLGPGSEIVLDRFVYDPDRNTGDIVFDAVKGSFRFVTGVADPASYRVLTSVAAIGIRGTDFDVYAIDGGTLVLARSGIPFACPRRLESDLDPDHGSCCVLDADEAGAPVYGIVTRRGRRCVGPTLWTGTNPGRLLRRHAAAERRDMDDDPSNRSSAPRSGGSGSNSSGNSNNSNNSNNTGGGGSISGGKGGGGRIN